MEDPSLEILPPDRLALLLDLDAPAHWGVGGPEDAGAALAHQLAAPLLPDLAHYPGSLPAEVEHVLGQHAHRTFQLHLTSSAPVLEILEAIKSWARHLRADSASPLSPGPATVFYYAAIAAALVALDRRISSLSEAQLQEGFAWSLEQPGAAPLGGLFTAALAALT